MWKWVQSLIESLDADTEVCGVAVLIVVESDTIKLLNYGEGFIVRLGLREGGGRNDEQDRNDGSI